MKINAIKTYLNNKPYKLSKKINSVVIGGVALASTIIGGSAYLGRDKNYSDTFMQIKQSKIVDIQDHALARLVNAFGVEDLQLNQSDDLFYDFEGKIGAFGKISGQFYQNYYNKNQFIGIVNKKGLFSNDDYDFMIKFDKSQDEKPIYTFDLSLCPNDEAHDARSILIEQKPDGYEVLIDGKPISNKDTRDAKTFGLVLLGVSVASFILYATEKNSKKPFKVLI